MSTINHLESSILDLRERFTKELQFSHTAQAQITAAFNTLSESLDHVEQTVNNAFAERNRALELALGTAPERQEQAEGEASPPARKPKLAAANG
jgi:hypothetical protein